MEKNGEMEWRNGTNKSSAYDITYVQIPDTHNGSAKVAQLAGESQRREYGEDIGKENKSQCGGNVGNMKQQIAWGAEEIQKRKF